MTRRCQKTGQNYVGIGSSQKGREDSSRNAVNTPPIVLPYSLPLSFLLCSAFPISHLPLSFGYLHLAGDIATSCSVVTVFSGQPNRENVPPSALVFKLLKKNSDWHGSHASLCTIHHCWGLRDYDLNDLATPK